MLLSPRGIRACNVEGTWFLSVYGDCEAYIARSQMPKFAISNGFCVEFLPEGLRDLTSTERLLRNQ